VRKLAFQLATQNGILKQSNSNKNAFGRDWLKGFLKRHP